MRRDTPHTLVRSACLSEDEVLAFAGGQLTKERRQEAHDHLDECELCQTLLNEAVHGLATAATANGGTEEEEAAWSTLFRPGTVVGQRYLVRRFVARGGMGEVYEALDRELSERVALKTVTSTACDDPTAVRRLKAEVQLARRVSHPNVCRIYDFGMHVTSESGAQLAFLTMEFVDGATLGKRIRLEGALPLAETVSIARRLLEGLRAAHDAGVLHRDFKSDNVILRRDADRSWPLILDFGLARTLDPYREQSSASQRGLVGTFAYIAPEQLEGKPHTTASDVYSFGIVLFEMLTGELPFKPRSAPAVTTLDRLIKPPPSPSSVNAAVPPYLDELVLACLRRSPEDRLATAGDVLQRLDELQRRLPGRKRSAAPSWLLGAALIAGISYGVMRASRPAPAPIPAQTLAAAPSEKPIIEAPAAATSTARVAEPGPIVRPAAPPQPTASSRPEKVRSTPAKSPPVAAPSSVLEAPAPAVAPPAPSARVPGGGWENPFER